MHKAEVRYDETPPETFLNVRAVEVRSGGVIEIEYQDGGRLLVRECKSVYVYPDDGED